ncbi:hypothetical protein E2C01_033714 [Portunus trituberculatus]|uniref:Uncharacterized protein n=1 Tax=Portunus trituberculatus TaxID=210409 RepID=A0A5B7F4H4_PORTR|nr:hypothetical protein [Portunus trituberculatus]
MHPRKQTRRARTPAAAEARLLLPRRLCFATQKRTIVDVVEKYGHEAEAAVKVLALPLYKTLGCSNSGAGRWLWVPTQPRPAVASSSAALRRWGHSQLCFRFNLYVDFLLGVMCGQDKTYWLASTAAVYLPSFPPLPTPPPPLSPPPPPPSPPGVGGGGGAVYGLCACLLFWCARLAGPGVPRGWPGAPPCLAGLHRDLPHLPHRSSHRQHLASLPLK